MPFFDRFRKKKTDAGQAKAEDATRHCFVLCKADSPIDLSRAPGVVVDVFGKGYFAEFDEKGIVTVTKGKDRDTVGFLAHVPVAVPGGEAEQNADGNFLWPNGRDEAAAHRAHVIVTNMGGGGQTAVQSAITVSRLALVALRLFDGIGVYWGNASVCNSRDVFEDFCQEMSGEHLPVPVWLRFQVVPRSDGGFGMYTLGMNQFGLMDIEVDRCTRDAGDLFMFLSNLAHYLIQNGPVIGDGNTVGASSEERILVRHRPSMIDKKRKVYKIIFDE